MEEQKHLNPAIIGTIIVLVLAVAGYGAFKYIKKDTGNSETPIENNPEVPVTPPTPTPPPVVSTSVYKNGTYSSEGNYVSPGGAESINVTLTLKDDVITDATVTSNAFRPNSIHFQGLFIANYKPLVIGKNIDDVQLDKVSGSSLAPKGFNDALAEIKAQARV